MKQSSFPAGWDEARVRRIIDHYERQGAEEAAAERKAMSMKDLIWVSFDLGIQGDYEGIYSWLDTHNAVECGDSMAGLKYEYNGDLIEELKSDLEGSIAIDKKTRIYVIRLVSGKMKGRFIFGSRKNPPWTGFGVGKGAEEEDVS